MTVPDDLFSALSSKENERLIARRSHSDEEWVVVAVGGLGGGGGVSFRIENSEVLNPFESSVHSVHGEMKGNLGGGGGG